MSRHKNPYGYIRPRQPYAFGDARREREIGDWGRASEHIGRRWESIGFQRLERLLGGGWWPRHRAIATVPLMSDPAIETSITRLCLPSPDVLVLLDTRDRPGRLVVQPVDFKWDLEFASYDQIRATTLAALFDRDPGPLAAALAARSGFGLADVDFVDGRLFAPERPANRAYLSSQSNRRREMPVEVSEVVFAGVAAHEFFPSLPGWPMAEVLAHHDHALHALEHIEGAERYYRLGAGLLGAVSKLNSSVFVADPPLLDAMAAVAWMERQMPTGSIRTIDLLGEVDARMRERALLAARLRQLTRSPCRPAELHRILSRHGVNVHEEDVLEALDPQWRDLLRRAAVEHRETVLCQGRELTIGGASDEEALTLLEGDASRLHYAARELVEQAIVRMLAAVG